MVAVKAVIVVLFRLHCSVVDVMNTHAWVRAVLKHSVFVVVIKLPYKP